MIKLWLYKVAQRRLFELALEQYELVYAARERGDNEQASKHHLCAKAFSIASKALDGDVYSGEGNPL